MTVKRQEHYRVARRRPAAAVCLLFGLLPYLPAPDSRCAAAEPRDLQTNDLTGAEYIYVERFIVLERAKAVALEDPDAGAAVFDSLAVAWGDSSEVRTAQLAPTDPGRALAVAELLRRLLTAEQDSLLTGTPRERLSAPLPPPAVTPTDD